MDDPIQAERLVDDGYRDRLAEALARSIREASADTPTVTPQWVGSRSVARATAVVSPDIDYSVTSLADAGRQPDRITRPPTTAGHRSAIHPGRALGLIGLLATLGLYLVVVERGLRIAAAAHDDFRSVLAAGLALVMGIQAFIIAAGNLKLIPLTGITLPLISYGGSSLLANAIVVGLLLALSDRGAGAPAPPRHQSGPIARLRRTGA